MAPNGLSFANPYSLGTETEAAPDTLAPSSVDAAVLGALNAPKSQLPPLRRAQPTSIALNRAENKLFVQGTTFSADDEAAALEAEKLIGGPGTGLPTGGGWTPLSEDAYRQYTSAIRNPSVGKLMAKNFGRGIDALQLLGGYGLQLAGAEDMGGRIVAQQAEDLAKTAPYERQFTDIESSEQAIDWLAANFAQMGPSMLESAFSAGIGFLAGTAAAGPLAGVGGAMAGLLGKSALKQAAMAALKKRAAGEALSAAEKKTLQKVAGIAGAAAATYASNVGTGAADIYGEMRQEGVSPDDTGAKLTALAGSIPYAAMESLPEFLMATRLFGGRFAPPPMTGGVVRRGAQLLKRGTKGAVVGGVGEGGTELGQEALVMGLAGEDLSSPEAVNRFINAFAAGFGVGAPLGGAVNLRGRSPQDMLNPGNVADPVVADAAPTATVEEQPFTLSGEQTYVASPEEVIAQRDALLDERRRLEGYSAELQRNAAVGDAARNVAQLRGVQQAITQIDQQLASPEYVNLPSVGMAAARAQEGQFGLFTPAQPRTNTQAAPVAPPLTLSGEQTYVASPEEVIAQRDALLDERRRLAQHLASLPEAGAYTGDATADIAAAQRVNDVRQAIAQIDQQLASPEYANLPPVGAAAVQAQEGQFGLFAPTGAGPVARGVASLRRGLRGAVKRTAQARAQATAQLMPQYVERYATALATGDVSAQAQLDAEATTQFGRIKWAQAKAKVVREFNARSAKVRREVASGAAKLRRGKPNAVQERSAAQVDVREPARSRQRVRSRDASKEAPRASAKIRKSEKERPAPKADGRAKQAVAATARAMDAEHGRFATVDGEVTGRLDAGRIKLLSERLVGKLKLRPKVSQFAGLGALKAKAPALYARAKAAYEGFDAKAERAAGFSVGDQVIIFSNNIKSEQHLKFVLAHEALGHFGLRALLDTQRLNNVLQDVYDADAKIRAEVDRRVDATGADKLEATEEAMADMAATLDVSVIARVWNAIKGALSRIFGVRFGDETARYWVAQVRRNMRDGDVVTAGEVLKRMEAMRKVSEEGRFSVASDAANFASSAFAANAMNDRSYGLRGFRALVGRLKAANFESISGGMSDVMSGVLETVQTLDNIATRSEGLQMIFQIMQDQAARTRSLLSRYDQLTRFSHMPRWNLSSWFSDKVAENGPTDEELTQAGALLSHGALLRSKQLTDKAIRDVGPLFIADGKGGVKVNTSAVQKAISAGEVDRETFQKGFDVITPLGEAVAFKPDFEITDRVWKVYSEQRDAINQAAQDVLRAHIEAHQERNVAQFNKLKSDYGYTSADVAALKRVLDEYTKLYAEGAVEDGGVFVYQQEAIAKAEAFIREITRALFEKAKVADWKKGAGGTEQFQDAQYKDIIAALDGLNARTKDETMAYTVRDMLTNLLIMETQISKADAAAKRTIMGSYAPFVRRGKYQVKLVPYTASGERAELSAPYMDSLPYFQDNSRSNADALQAEMNGLFKGKTFTVLDKRGNKIKVTLQAERSRTLEGAPVTGVMDIDSFFNVANRLHIALTPAEQARIVTALTNADARARKSLQRSGSPGWDKDVVKYVAEHLHTQGNAAGRAYYKQQLMDISVDKRLWRGNYDKLMRLKGERDAARKRGNPDETKTAEAEYDKYAYMYKYMADVTNAKQGEVEIGGKPEKTLGRGNIYQDQAARLLDWYMGTNNITDSTEDMLSSGIASQLKLSAVIMQLGGSIATAAINLFSLSSNTLPYLATYNEKRGFGGGFGAGKSAHALYRAMADMKNAKLAKADYLDRVVQDNAEGKALRDKHGITMDEAQFLRESTASGVLQAAQFNALVGTAMGGITNNNVASGIQAWMSMFAYTEQLNRRVTALAAYRLERDRQLAAGKSPKDSYAAAATEARRTVNTTQGEYAMFNRPEMARGNVAQYIFMYKQFVIISIELMKALSPEGRMMFLGTLFLMSGLKGMPFADDIADLIDTLAQMFGIKSSGVEKAIGEALDSVAPGLTPVLMRGFLDRFTGMTVSSRLGLSDLFPLTGAFKAGADPARELANFAGPIWGGVSGMVATTAALGRYGLEAIGAKEDVTSLNSILRNQPISALRAVADGFTYMADGAVTNAQGRVIDPDLTTMTVVGRMMGFYPASATLANDVIRMSRGAAAYAFDIRNSFTAAYVKAAAENDAEEMARIREVVREWNQDNRGTEFEFKSWFSTAARAAREAKRPAVLRMRKAVGTQTRDMVDELARVYGLEY